MKRLILTFSLGLLFFQTSHAQQIKIKFVDFSFKKQYASTPLLSISNKPLIALANNDLKTILPNTKELLYSPLLNKTASFNSKIYRSNMPCEPLFDLSFLADFLK